MQFVGIDIAGVKKGQAVAIMDEGLTVTHLWHNVPAGGLAVRVLEATGPDIIAAIDAPRMPARNETGKWGRECDRRVFRMGITIQWTPVESIFSGVQEKHAGIRDWMGEGFKVFRQFEALLPPGRVIEAFPSAGYGRFGPEPVSLPLSLIHRKAKTDQLDAVSCAMTARHYYIGRYEAVGDDREGYIILPSS